MQLHYSVGQSFNGLSFHVPVSWHDIFLCSQCGQCRCRNMQELEAVRPDCVLVRTTFQPYTSFLPLLKHAHVLAPLQGILSYAGSVCMNISAQICMYHFITHCIVCILHFLTTSSSHHTCLHHLLAGPSKHLLCVMALTPALVRCKRCTQVFPQGVPTDDR